MELGPNNSEPSKGIEIPGLTTNEGCFPWVHDCFERVEGITVHYVAPFVLTSIPVGIATDSALLAVLAGAGFDLAIFLVRKILPSSNDQTRPPSNNQMSGW